MNWEIKKRNAKETLWQGRDGEGRRIYTISKDREGIAMEPNGCSIFYSVKAAMTAGARLEIN